MQDDLNKFKKELEWLVGKQAEAAPPPASVSSVGIFDKFIEEDKQRDLYAEEVARISAINKSEKACPSCYRRQPHANETCRLCKEKPERWLPAAEVNIRQGAGLDEGAIQRNWQKWLSTSATVEHLQEIVAKSSAMDSAWKIKHAARILRLLNASVPLDFYGQPVDTDYIRKPVAEPPENVAITEHQVESALSYLDIQLKKIEAEQEELRKKQEERSGIIPVRDALD